MVLGRFFGVFEWFFGVFDGFLGGFVWFCVVLGAKVGILAGFGSGIGGSGARELGEIGGFGGGRGNGCFWVKLGVLVC